MAVGSAAITFNIDFVLDGLAIRHYIDAVVSADDGDLSKPHPETFTKCAFKLGLSSEECVVFEDAPKGVEAALNAGMDCIVITTLHGQEEFQGYANVVATIDTYEDASVLGLLS